MEKSASIDFEALKFKNSKPVETHPDKYIQINVDTAKVLESWALSLYSFEWILTNGEIKSGEDLKPTDREKQEQIMQTLETSQPLEQAVLGIGIQDNVEIGSARAVFLTLAYLGAKTLPVHVLKSCESDFKDFRTDL